MSEVVVDDAGLALIAAGWEQLPSGKWRHPSMIQRGRCKPLTRDEATARLVESAPAAVKPQAGG